MINQDLAKLIAYGRDQDPVMLEVGTILSFTTGTSSVATSAAVDLEGAGVATTCLALDSYTDGTPAPAAGDQVLVISQGQLSIIVGRIS